LKNNLIQRTI